MSKVKYIKTKDNEIIVFSELQQHIEFQSFNPVTAGFISIGFNDNRELDIQCYGKSVSLELESDPIEDSRLAKRQILGYSY